jgi:uncharacterized DUF497 family protein
MYAQMCIYLAVSYEWDPAKAQANFEKHGIYFAMPLQRWKTTSRLQCAILSQKTKTGGSLSGRMLLAVYSLWFTRGEKIMPA